MKIKLERRQGDYGFEVVDEQGHTLQTDSSRESGGTESGFRPMQLLLGALGSCSAIDIVSILIKQKTVITDFSITVAGEREQDVIPSLWKQVHVTFHLAGAIDVTKAERAAALSMEKYCSVAETLRRAGARMTWSVVVNQNQAIEAERRG
jgi:putative redox protein